MLKSTTIKSVELLAVFLSDEPAVLAHSCDVITCEIFVVVQCENFVVL